MESKVLTTNEIKANKYVAKVMRISILFMIAIFILNEVGIFIVDRPIMITASVIAILLLITPTVIVDVLKVEAGWVKYISVTLAILMVGILTICLNYHVVSMYMFGMILATFFFSKKLDIYALFVSIVVLTASQMIGYGMGGITDYNAPNFYYLITYNIAPRLIQLILLSIIFIIFNGRTEQLLSMCVGAEEQKSVLKQLIKLSDKSYEASGVLASSVEELRTISEQTFESNRCITKSAKQVVSHVDNTVGFLGKATESVKSISNNLDQIALQSDKVSTLSEKVNKMSVKNGEMLGSASSAMLEINSSTQTNKKIINALGEKSNEIKDIVSVISGIATQTNLLALNAAIESARAGEEGRGFAVVADEIRKLAEQSQKSTLHIAAIIEEVAENTQEAVEAMDSSVNVVQQGMSILEQAKNFSNEVVEASNQMNATVQELAAVMGNVAESGEQIVTVVEEVEQLSSHSKEELEQIAVGTKQQLAATNDIVSLVKLIEGTSEQLVEISADSKNQHA